MLFNCAVYALICRTWFVRLLLVVTCLGFMPGSDDGLCFRLACLEFYAEVIGGRRFGCYV